MVSSPTIVVVNPASKSISELKSMDSVIIKDASGYLFVSIACLLIAFFLQVLSVMRVVMSTMTVGRSSPRAEIISVPLIVN